MRYLPLMLLCLTGLAQAGIYKTYDKHGNVIFSDTPTPDAQEIEDKPVATIPALSRSIIEKNAKAKTNNITATAAEPESYKITIANIKANDTFRREDPPNYRQYSVRASFVERASSTSLFRWHSLDAR